jgi:hypothetical protein
MIRLDHVRLKREHNVSRSPRLRFFKVPLLLLRNKRIYLTSSISRPAGKHTKQISICADYKAIS